jgi:hypothetical protein
MTALTNPNSDTNLNDNLAPMLLSEDQTILAEGLLIRAMLMRILNYLGDKSETPEQFAMNQESINIVLSIRHAEPWVKFREDDITDMIENLYPMVAYDLWLSRKAELVHECEQVLIKYINESNLKANIKRD